VGQVTSYERLILELWTDGTVSPIDAVSQAAQVLVEKIHLFYDLAYRRDWVTEKPGLPVQSEEYNTPIEQLSLSVRTFNCLKRAGITKVGELLEYSDEELLKIKNLGQKALEEVHSQLKEMGFVSEEGSPSEEATLQEGEEEEDIE